jgi:predicted helicase
MLYQVPKIFPKSELKNLAICTTGVGNRIEFSSIICDAIPDLHMGDSNGACQCFPLFLYEKNEPLVGKLFQEEDECELIDGYRRKAAITDAIHTDFREAYEATLSKEDVFYYVYGVLHSPEYRARFSSDLKKMLPRIPFTKETVDFWRFSQAGRDLAHWHLNYENVEPYPLNEQSTVLNFDSALHYKVQKMTFGRKNKAIDKTTVVYNSHITLTGIPLEAYDYIVNGKPAIEWIMERYQLTRDKDSGIINDPNDWSREHNQPRYILDLLKRVVNVSVETLKIVNTLPALNERIPE